MDVTDLKIDNFRECLRLTQRSIYTGLLLTVLALTAAFQMSENTNQKLPLVGIEFSSVEAFVLSLMVLYIAFGTLCWFALARAISIHSKIGSEDIAHAILFYPALINSPKIYKYLLALVLMGGWYAILEETWNLSWWITLPIGVVITLPYSAAFGFGDDLIPRG